MKERINPAIKAHLIGSLFYVLLLLTVCAIPFSLAQQDVAKPTNIIVVTNTNDSGPGSLRDSLAAGNDGDTIDATGVSGTILLTSGELQINHNVTINGPGAENLAVNGNATSRVFENFASDVTISGFTITNGSPPEDTAQGGGILNHGGLTVSGSSIVNNNAQFPPPFLGSGGGIFNNLGGTLTVTNSTISNNTCGGFGGGINTLGGAITVMNSVISGNSAISGISMGAGGGIAFEDTNTLTVTNSTISGNSADGVGGGIWKVNGTMTVTNSTISANSAPTGGGILIDGAGTAQIGDTILNAGASGGTIVIASGTASSLGYNLASDNGVVS